MWSVHNRGLLGSKSIRYVGNSDLGVAVWRYWEHLGRAGGCESPTAFGDPCFDCYGCTVEAQCPAGIGPVDYRRLGVQHWARMLSHRAMVTT